MAARLHVGVPTVRDILDALARPGRDPREDLPPPIFKKGILKLEDLQPGMELKGTVLNVVDFGAFVDIGLKDSGLVHISQMANRYIKSPYDVVAVGDVVTVWVLTVDKDRHRVSLTMIQPGHRAQAAGAEAARGPSAARRTAAAPGRPTAPSPPAASCAATAPGTGSRCRPNPAAQDRGDPTAPAAATTAASAETQPAETEADPEPPWPAPARCALSVNWPRSWKRNKLRRNRPNHRSRRRKNRRSRPHPFRRSRNRNLLWKHRRKKSKRQCRHSHDEKRVVKRGRSNPHA